MGRERRPEVSNAVGTIGKSFVGKLQIQQRLSQMLHGWSSDHFSLFGWPAVASHMVVLILGYGMANLSHKPASTLSENMPPQKTLLLTLPKQFFRQLPKDIGSPVTEGLFAIVNHDKTAGWSAPCRLTPHLVRIIKAPTWLALTVPIGQAPSLAVFDQLLRKSKVTLGSANEFKAVPLCNKRPKVTYGSTTR